MLITEDRWTPASPWCGRPERWHADTADATEREVSVLVSAFVRALQPETAAETGTNSGQSALAIARALRDNGHGHLWTLETDVALAVSARGLLAGYPATVICGSSLTWNPPRPVDFAWLDSGPLTGEPGDSGALRRDELARWLPRFAPGAVIGVHDTAPHHPVMRAVEPFLRAQGMMFLNLRTPRGVLFAQVPG